MLSFDLNFEEWVCKFDKLNQRWNGVAMNFWEVHGQSQLLLNFSIVFFFLGISEQFSVYPQWVISWIIVEAHQKSEAFLLWISSNTLWILHCLHSETSAESKNSEVSVRYDDAI